MSQTHAEIEALWIAIYGEPPPITAPTEMLIDILVRCLPCPDPFTNAGPAAGPAEIPKTGEEPARTRED